MPKLFEFFNYKVYFWSNEGEPLEPIHIHIGEEFNANSTKIWLNSDGTFEVANNNSRIPNKALNRMLKSMKPYYDEIVKSWEEYYKKPAIYHDTYKTKEESIDKPRFNPNLGKSR